MANQADAGRVYTPETTSRTYPVDHEETDRVIRRVSPSAILAGGIVGVVLLFLLGLLGVGIGTATIDPAPGESGTPSAGTFGMVSAIWGVLTFLIALFAAGWVAARLAGDPKKLDGLLHGVVAWALTTLVVMWMMTTTVSSVLGGAFSLVGNIASTSAQGVQAAASGQSGQAISGLVDQLPWDRIQEQVQQSLPADVELNRQTLMAAMRELVTSGGDRQAVIDVLVDQGGMTQQQAQGTLQELETTYEETREQAEQQAAEAASAAAGTVSTAALAAFVALLLGGLAAAGGGWVGAPQDRIATRRAV